MFRNQVISDPHPTLMPVPDPAPVALALDAVTKVFPREPDPAVLRARAQATAGLSRLFGRRPSDLVPVVDRVTFAVRRGEIYGLLGTNGSGKSTVIRMIATLLEPDAGSIRVFGCDPVADPKAVRRLLNRVSADAAFFKRLSPLENLGYTARIYGLPVAEAERKVAEILAGLDFDLARLHEPMEGFSRGMQQKVAIARAFMTAPVLLLLDEPTTGLDPRSRRDVKEYLLRLRATHDATVLLTTHDMAEAEALCDRIAFLRDGRLVAEGTPEALRRTCTPGGRGTLEEVFLDLTGGPPGLEMDSA